MELAKPIEILLVEDNAGDARLTEEALRDAHVANRLHVVRDGVEAMAFLRREPPFADVPLPHLVLLDLNLPRKDGREVLGEIKADPALRSLPVVVLTTSRSEQDILKSYHLQANAYVVKPVDLDQFLSAVRAIEDFWLVVVSLPAVAAGPHA